MNTIALRFATTHGSTLTLTEAKFTEKMNTTKCDIDAMKCGDKECTPENEKNDCIKNCGKCLPGYRCSSDYKCVLN